MCLRGKNQENTLSSFWQYFLNNFWNHSQKDKLWNEKQAIELDEKQRLFFILEANAGIELREGQKQALTEIFDSIEQSKPIVYQWTMGGGKTSVFGTCLAAYSAKILHKLPVFIFPSSILDTNVKFMNDRLWKVFGMKLFRLHMQRGTHFYSLDYLSFVFYQLYTYFESQDGAVVCSPGTIQCFLNARKELLTFMTEKSDE